MVLAISPQSIISILLVVLILLFGVLVLLYFMGRRLQERQAAQQPMIEANTMEVSMLIIDKKKLSVKAAVAAGLPEQVEEELPFYLRFSKLMADPTVYEILPVKKEVKCAVSGIYIRSIKSVRGGVVPEAPKKKGLFANLRKKAEDEVKKQQAKK